MSDFKAKMHQIRFRLGFRPNPAGRAYSASLPTSKGRGGRERGGGKGRGREGRRGEEGEEWGLIRVSIRSPYFFADLRPWSSMRVKLKEIPKKEIKQKTVEQSSAESVKAVH